MSDYLNLLAGIRERARKDYEEARTQLRTACRKHDISKIEIEFDGYGDSGTVTLSGEHDPEVALAAENYACALLEQMFPGWEINEGSLGTITVDLEKSRVDTHFGARVESVEWRRRRRKL